MFFQCICSVVVDPVPVSHDCCRRLHDLCYVVPDADAFFRQDLELLPASLPDALRAQSSALLTDFTAQDYARLGEILEFLANRAAPIRADALPGAWDRASGTYSVTEASRAAVQTFLNVSPTDEQASSASEP